MVHVCRSLLAAACEVAKQLVVEKDELKSTIDVSVCLLMTANMI